VKPFNISQPASAELTEAVRWYERKRPGVGDELLKAVAAATELIQRHPEIGTPRRGQLPTRQFQLQRFPYRLVYRVREHDLYLVAVAHTSRRPDYWKDRQ
jgi:plasmid stabilization system protein ParE